MTDRELLELAARALGIEHVTPSMIEWGHWDSLENDGDTFLLAVYCGIGMCFHDGWGEVFHPAVGCLPFKYEDDKRKATRFAISMLAAEIGKGMK